MPSPHSNTQVAKGSGGCCFSAAGGGQADPPVVAQLMVIEQRAPALFLVRALTTQSTTLFRVPYLTGKECKPHEEQLRSALFPVPTSFSPVAGMFLMWHFLPSGQQLPEQGSGAGMVTLSRLHRLGLSPSTA